MKTFELKYENTIKNGNCLYTDKPIVVNRELASILGDVDLAIILQEIHYWININKQNAEMELANIHTYYDGCFWCFRTYEDWLLDFPWLSLRTLKRKFKKLEELNLLISSNFNKLNIDRTKWYTINYDKLAEFEKQFQSKKIEKIQQKEIRKTKQKDYNKNTVSQSAKMALSPKCQNDTIDSAKMALPIQEDNIQEINYIQDNNISLSVVDNQNSKKEMTDGQTNYTQNFKIELDANNDELNNLVIDIANDVLANQKTITVNNKKININKLITELQKLDKQTLAKLITYVAQKFESNNNDNIKNKNKYIASIFANAVFEKGYLLSEFKNNNENNNKTSAKNKFVNYNQNDIDYDTLRAIELQSLAEGVIDDNSFLDKLGVKY